MGQALTYLHTFGGQIFAELDWGDPIKTVHLDAIPREAA